MYGFQTNFIAEILLSIQRKKYMQKKSNVKFSQISLYKRKVKNLGLRKLFNK